MASINLSGVLRDPLGEVSYGNKMRFTHNTTTGETVKGFRSSRTIEINGEYDFDLEYGNVHIESWDYTSGLWISHGVITINSDTPATSIPALIGITTPATDADLLVFQALVADAESARDDAQTAQSNTEALFNDFDSSVADSLSDIGSNIAFEAAFNDSNAIQRGYGTHDVIDASAAQDGSVEVELPTKSVDFSCASERTVINKSGMLEAVGVDQPAIDSNGEWLHGAYANTALWSDDFTHPSWVKASSSATVTTDGTLKPYVNSTEDAQLLFSSELSIQQVVSTTVGQDYVISGIIKKATSSKVAFGQGDTVVDFDNGVIESTLAKSAKLTAMADGWFRCDVYWEATNTVLGVRPLIISAALPDDANVYVARMQFTEGTVPLPFIKTESVSVSVAKTIASIPAMNNFPPTGKPFAVEVDCAIPEIGRDTRVFSQTNSFYLRRSGSGSVNAAFGGIQTTGNSTDSTIHKFVVRVAERIDLFIDGVLTNSSGLLTGDESADLSEKLLIGNYGLSVDFQLNSQLKNFRVHHGLISDDTIKSWGGAK